MTLDTFLSLLTLSSHCPFVPGFKALYSIPQALALDRKGTLITFGCFLPSFSLSNHTYYPATSITNYIGIKKRTQLSVILGIPPGTALVQHMCMDLYKTIPSGSDLPRNIDSYLYFIPQTIWPWKTDLYQYSEAQLTALWIKNTDLITRDKTETWNPLKEKYTDKIISNKDWWLP